MGNTVNFIFNLLCFAMSSHVCRPGRVRLWMGCSSIIGSLEWRRLGIALYLSLQGDVQHLSSRERVEGERKSVQSRCNRNTFCSQIFCPGESYEIWGLEIFIKISQTLYQRRLNLRMMNKELQ